MSSTDALTEDLKKLEVSDKVLYYSLKFSESEYDEISNIIKNNISGCIFSDDKKTLTYKNNVYTLNSEFHITVLFTGGKKDDREEKLEESLGKKFNVTIERIGVNANFIALGVNVANDMPYYGNDVKHITVGLNKTDPKKKVLPKDSFKSLLCDDTQNEIILLEKSVDVFAVLDAVKQQQQKKPIEKNQHKKHTDKLTEKSKDDETDS